MTREALVADLRTRFSEQIVEFSDTSPTRVYIEIRPDGLVSVASYLFGDLGARFNIASGVDVRSHIEVIYHFSVEDLKLLVSLRVKLDRDQPRVTSLANLIKGTNWIEREIHEMLGVEFEGHPDPRRLLLSDQWPEGIYPLRADYREWDATAVRDRGV